MIILYTKEDVWRVCWADVNGQRTRESQNWCRCIDHSRGVDTKEQCKTECSRLTLRTDETFWPNAFETIILRHTFVDEILRIRMA
jgi:hypothetical protein